MRNPISNIRRYKTICTFSVCLVLGFYSGIIGPSLVHMEYVLHTTTQGMAMAFTGDNMGSLIGAIVCAYVCEKYGNWEFQFVIACVISAIFNSLAPWMPNVYWYCFVMACRSGVATYIAAAAKAYILNLWSDHRWKDAIFQGYLSTWCIGAFIAPILAIPFLCHLPEHHNRNRIKESLNSSQILSSNYKNGTETYASNIAMRLHKEKSKILDNKISTENQDFPEDIFKVRYLYTVVSLFAICVAVMFYHTRNQHHHRIISVKAKTNEVLTHKENPISSQKVYLSDIKSHILRKLLEVLIFTYGNFIEWHSTILGIFLSVFVIKGLGWSTTKGPLIISVFRLTQGLGRICGIPVSLYISSSKILIINMSFGLISYTLMYLAVTFYHSDLLMWLATALAGFSISTSYSAALLWGTQHLHTSAAYCSLFSASASVGSMTSAALAGYLFQNYSPLAIIYMILISAVINVFVFCGMTVIGELYSSHVDSKTTSKSDELTYIVQ